MLPRLIAPFPHARILRLKETALTEEHGIRRLSQLEAVRLACPWLTDIVMRSGLVEMKWTGLGWMRRNHGGGWNLVV